MSDLPRLNRFIECFEQGVPAFGFFSKPDVESALMLGNAPVDGVVIEGEHCSWDPYGIRDYLQYMLDRRQILRTGSPAPAVTPIVRVPANGAEMNQFLAKQALDLGAFGIVWPHVSTIEQAASAVAACRYPRLKMAPRYEPAGQRGDGPGAAVRYWGITQQEYYARADVWPLDPQGELLVILMCEDLEGMENLDQILAEVPGVGAILIGEGDLSQELGIPRQYDHPDLLAAMAQIVATCKKHGVPVGHPHATRGNAERLIAEGYDFLLGGVDASFGFADAGRAALVAGS